MIRKAILLGILVLAICNVFAPAPAEAAKKPTAVSYHDEWRKLWEDHIEWTRMVIVAVFDDLPGEAIYITRLLKNADDMEAALAPYYGAEDAAAFGDLIQEHLVIAAELLQAAEDGNATAFEDARVRWYQNGADLAALMAQLNPNFWELEEVNMMWIEHLDATLAEAVAHLTGDFQGDVDAYDLVHELALEMADFFSRGVAFQFPEEFRKNGCLKSKK